MAAAPWKLDRLPLLMGVKPSFETVFFFDTYLVHFTPRFVLCGYLALLLFIGRHFQGEKKLNNQMLEQELATVMRSYFLTD